MVLPVLGPMQGFVFAAIGGVGLYVCREQTIDVNCMISWGMFTCLYGIITLVGAFDALFKANGEWFNKEFGAYLNFVRFLQFALPVVEIVNAYCVYKVYKDATDYESSTTIGGGGGGGSQYGSLRARDNDAAPAADRPSGFVPFGGKGNTLTR